MENNFGLKEGELEKINLIFSKYENINEVLIYGSRALKKFKPFSDIDLTIVGKNINLSLMNSIETDLDGLLLPYKFDLSNLKTIENVDLVAHIEKFGIVFHKKEKQVIST